jgi:hypothetical protein
LGTVRTGNLLIVAGLVIAVVGIAVRFGLFSWFGNLPGDLRFEGERSTVFIPFTSMLVVSVGGSLVLNLVLRLFRD